MNRLFSDSPLIVWLHLFSIGCNRDLATKTIAGDTVGLKLLMHVQEVPPGQLRLSYAVTNEGPHVILVDDELSVTWELSGGSEDFPFFQFGGLPVTPMRVPRYVLLEAQGPSSNIDKLLLHDALRGAIDIVATREDGKIRARRAQLDVAATVLVIDSRGGVERKEVSLTSDTTLGEEVTHASSCQVSK